MLWFEIVTNAVDWVGTWTKYGILFHYVLTLCVFVVVVNIFYKEIFASECVGKVQGAYSITILGVKF